MKSTRLYINTELRPDLQVLLPAEQHRYMHSVLRLRAGDSVVLFNGSGSDFNGIISESSKKSSTIQLHDGMHIGNESPVHTHLFQAISKGDRMDNAIQKSIELGVSEITPMISERTVVRIDEKRLQKKHLHWEKIIISACEQSGRSVIPKLHPIINFTDALDAVENEHSYILSPEADCKLSSIQPGFNRCSIFIGPEGGFSEPELNVAKQHSVKEIKMGNRVLRTETAPIAVLSVIQMLAGDF
ncbi:MAG: 16S rRNA (uracil(1498)-N(3))-methyltransferase [Gammaproteobacteria bacterium]|nr:16S rRNA (uracil(1498)-N(3))-methyltransferase [Gammaproteobacteria bacterium]